MADQPNRSGRDLHPLSDSQLMVLWGGISSSVHSTSLPYSSLCFRMRVPDGNAPALEEAWWSVVAAYDSLRLRLTRLPRTRETRKDYAFIGSFPYRRWLRGLRQYIAPHAPAPLPLLSLEGEEALEAFIGEFRTTQKPRLDSPLCDAVLIRMDDRSLVLLARFHHLVFDGYSFRLLYEGVSAAYEARLEGRDPALPVRSILPHLEHDREYRLSPRFSRDFAYWKKAFTSQPRFRFPAGWWKKGSSYGTVEAVLEEGTGRRLEELAARFGTGASVYSLLLANLGLTVYRLSGKDNFSLFHNSHGRIDADERRTIGAMMNSVPIFFGFDPKESLRDAVRSSLRTYMESLMHSRLSSNDMARFYWKESLRNLQIEHIWMFVSSIEVDEASQGSPYEVGFYGDTTLYEQFFVGINLLPGHRVRLFLRYPVPRRSKADADRYLRIFLETLERLLEEGDSPLSSLR